MCTGFQFSPILTILFKHSRKYEGVRKFVLKKLSYKFVFGTRNDNFKKETLEKLEL
jgi:hypothetical protein